MNRRSLLSLCFASAAIAAVPSTGFAQNAPIIIKLATKAPKDSTWHKLLIEASQRIREFSGDKVQFKIFYGGTMGDEGDNVKKMRIGQLHAAAISSVGLHDIAPEPQALDIPLLVKNNEERDYLLKKYTPKLDQILANPQKTATNSKPFPVVVLSWSDIGSAYFFSTKPRPNIAEARSSKLFCWDGDLASKDAWTAGGFKPVVLSSNDMVPSLKTGMIDTILYTPGLVLALQAHKDAKYMMALPYSTLTGATIIDKRVWDQIPANVQAKMKEVFADLGQRSTQEARRFNAEAITTMKKDGLQEVTVTDPAEWQKAVDSVRNVIRGRVVPEATFDEVIQIVKDYRAGKR